MKKFFILLILIIICISGYKIFKNWENKNSYEYEMPKVVESASKLIEITVKETAKKEIEKIKADIEKKEKIKAESAKKKEKTKFISLGVYKITAYCPCSKCTGKRNGSHTTASGAWATAGRTIAAPRNIPFGTKLKIKGHIYTVEDRGGAIKNKRLDIFFDTHQEALNWGVRNIEVFMLKE